MIPGKTLIALMAVALAACAAACGTAGPQASVPPVVPRASAAPVPTTVTDTPAAAGSPAPRTGSLQVLVEPAAGVGPIYQLITSARSSIDLTMYELNDPTAEADLAADAGRGVDVRVILDQNLERSANAAAYAYLGAHGVHVRWGPAGTTYHQKTLTVDGATSVIMTGNLVTEDYSDTRDFAVVDTNPADIAAIAATFEADFSAAGTMPSDGADLVWSPTNAQTSVLSVINGAAHTLAVEDEEMDDPSVTSALAAAARRGVDVEITMTADPEWDSAFTELAQAGVHVRLYPDNSTALYIHAKAIVADAGQPGQQALVGSQNFSVASLDYNRELGIRTQDPAVVAAISSTLAGDYAGAAAYSPAAASGAGPAGASGAWCTATASVYNSYDDENNVYVNSNQPDTTATATADGFSHSYQTNGSGYALIYLNGPPAGARITVTVGSATCSTSD